MRPFFFAAPVSLIALLAAGCSAGPDAPIATGDEQHLEEAPLKGAVWAKCWLASDGNADAFFRTYTLTCSGPSDAKYPLQLVGLDVEAQGKDGADASAFLVGPGSSGDPSAPRAVGRMFADKFPAKLIVQAVLSPSPSDALGSQLRQSVLRFETTIDAPDTLTADKPLVVRQPFDLWPITILQKTSQYFFIGDAMSLPAAPFTGSNGETSLDIDGNTQQSKDGQPLRKFYVVAPKTGPLSVRYFTGSTDIHVSVDGPGMYVAEDSTLRHATSGDSVDPTPIPTDDAGPAPDPGPDAGPPPPAPDAGTDSGPPPTCGVTGLVCCGGDTGTCDATSYCKNNPNGPNVCVTCGGANQDCCGGDRGTCGAATYCKSTSTGTNQCKACGAPGQDCCGGDKGTCNTGSYCKSTTTGTDQCQSCGGANQDCCGGDNGTCSAGLTCTFNSSGTNQCK